MVFVKWIKTAALETPTYKLAKYLVAILKPLTTTKYGQTLV